MLRSTMASSSSGEIILDWIEIAALAIEILAVAIIVMSILYATLFRPRRPSTGKNRKPVPGA